MATFAQRPFIFVPVAALTLGAVGGWHWWNVLHFLQSTDDGYVPSDVSVISPKVEGFIKKVKVTDNQEVAEGAVLFVIDDRDFQGQGSPGGSGRGDRRGIGREL